MNNVIDQFSCCLDKSLTDNTANYCLNTLGLRYGECKLSRAQVKDIVFILAHDLLEFAGIDKSLSLCYTKTHKRSLL